MSYVRQQRKKNGTNTDHFWMHLLATNNEYRIWHIVVNSFLSIFWSLGNLPYIQASSEYSK